MHQKRSCEIPTITVFLPFLDYEIEAIAEFEVTENGYLSRLNDPGMPQEFEVTDIDFLLPREGDDKTEKHPRKRFEMPPHLKRKALEWVQENCADQM